jgi:UDP-N-acetylmuramoyl-L-alanyl-D-glutamate--2,6-diaminopimelate ligase
LGERAVPRPSLLSAELARLSALLRDARIAGPGVTHDPEVTRIDDDSRRCEPGSLFVAVRGFHSDGHAFAADAVRRGAVAVVAEHPVDVPSTCPLLLVTDTRIALSALAAALEHHPSRDLCVAGVTGTDGKTTTCTLLWAAWRASGLRAASLTTVDWRCGDEVTVNRSRQTTLEAPELQHQLRVARQAGCAHVALETSSHGLALHRVADVDYRAAIYTRITSEHLDLHGSREAYLDAKAQLLRAVSPRRDGVAVLDATDEFALPVLAKIPVSQRVTYSIDPSVRADLMARSIAVDAAGVRFTATTPWGDADVELRLAGRFNAGNALAALAGACTTGARFEDAARGLATLDRVPGRMERVDLGQPFSVVVDYAHTAESLETVLRELRPATAGRLWVVFGSAGERDREKRPAMGAAAVRLADVAVITDEDPREEDRLRILEEIAAGATAAGGGRGENVVVVPDREEAIGFAISSAVPGDTVLLAGKGHEGSLITGTVAQPWDERAVAEAAIRARLGG